MSKFQKEFGNTPEEKEKRSKRNKKRYEDPINRQRTSEQSKNRIWINDGKENKFIKNENLENFLKNNTIWTIGKIGKSNKERITINKNNINKVIDKEELHYYIRNGWKLGGKKLKCTFKVINNGVLEKRVTEKDLDGFLKKDWVLGRLSTPNKGKFRIVFDETNKEILIDEKDLNYYISLGWRRGRKNGFTSWNNNRSHEVTKEVRDKHRKSMIGKNTWTKGSHRTEETKQKIRDTFRLKKLEKLNASGR